MKRMFSAMSNLQSNCRLELISQKVDQRTEGKYLIHGTKHHRDNQLQIINGRNYTICNREGCK